MPDKKNQKAHWDPYWVIEDAKALQRVVKELDGEGSQSVESDLLLFQGKFLAKPILLSLAIEIALKAWQRRERQGAPDLGHDLLQLFEGLEEATQKRLEAKMPALVDPLLGETLRKGLRELLCSHRDAFIKWRYPYEGDEEGSIFKTFEHSVVHQALDGSHHRLLREGARPNLGLASQFTPLNLSANSRNQEPTRRTLRRLRCPHLRYSHQTTSQPTPPRQNYASHNHRKIERNVHQQHVILPEDWTKRVWLGFFLRRPLRQPKQRAIPIPFKEAIHLVLEARVRHLPALDPVEHQCAGQNFAAGSRVCVRPVAPARPGVAARL